MNKKATQPLSRNGITHGRTAAALLMNTSQYNKTYETIQRKQYAGAMRDRIARYVGNNQE